MLEIKAPVKEYHKDDELVYSCQYHVIFCPKYRRRVLVNGIDDELKSLIISKEKEYGYRVLEMEIMPDHVHLLLDINPRIGVFRVVNQIKGYSSRILREEHKELRSRLPTLWTRSKFISTVGAVTLEAVKKYIDEQKNV